MRFKLIIFSFLLVALPIKKTIAQHIPNNTLFQIESSYRNGSYDRSYRLCNQVINKYETSKTNNKLVYSEALIYKLKNKLITNGRLNLKDSVETKYLETIKNISQDHYVIGLGRLAEIYSNYGFHKYGFSFLNKAKETLVKNPSIDALNQLRKHEIGVLNALGYYNQAYLLTQSQDAFEKSKIKEEYSFIYPESNCNLTGTYNSKQYTLVKRGYADFLNLTAQIKYNQGDYVVADSLAKIAYNWIGNHIDKKYRDVSAFDNRLLVVKIHEKLEQESKAYNLTVSRSVDDRDGMNKVIKKSYKGFTYYEESETYMDYEEYLARHYWNMKGVNIGMKSQADGFYAKHHSFYERMGDNRDNLNVIKSELMMIDKKIYSNKLKEAKKQLDSLISKKTDIGILFIPTIHPLKRLMLLKSIDINANLGLSNETNKRITQLQVLDKELLAQNSPQYKRDLLYIATIKHKVMSTQQESINTFNKYFFNDIENELRPLHAEHRMFTNEYIDLLLNTGDVSKSEKTLNKSVRNAIPHQYNNKNFYAQQLIKKADLYLKVGKYSEANLMLDESKKNGAICKLVSDNEFDHEETTNDYYRVLTRKNLLYGNLFSAKKSMNKISHLQDRDYIEFASIFTSNGKYSQITTELNNIKEKYSNNYGSISKQMMDLQKSRALVYSTQGEYGVASKSATEAIDIANKLYGNQSSQYADASHINGLTASYFGDYSSAIKQFNNAKSIYQKIYGKKVKYAKSLAELSLAQLYNNETTHVESQFNEATEIFTNSLGYTSFENAKSLKNLAFYYLEVNQIDKAEENIAQSIKILDDLGSKEYKQELAENHRITAKIQQYNKEYKKSEVSYKKALNYYNSLYSNKDHLDITLTKSNLAQLYYIQGERKDSKKTLNNTTEIYLDYINNYFKYLTEREKKEFWKKINLDFEFYKTLAFEENKKQEIETVYNNLLSTKGILLSSTKKLRQAIVNSDDKNLQETFEQWSDKKSTMTKAISMSDEQLLDENINIDVLQKEIDKLEKTLTEKSNAFASTETDDITWKSVRNKLGENEYAVEIVRYNQFDNTFTDKVIYKALVIGKHYDSPKVIDLPNGNKIDTRYLTYYRNTTKFKRKDKLSYKIFYKPIYELIGEGATVYFSPEGAYNLVNLEALLMQDGSYVMDKQNIVMVSSTKSILEPKNHIITNDNKNVLIVSNPMFYEENSGNTEHENTNPRQPIRQLPGAEEEGVSIDSIFKADNWNTTIVNWDKANEGVIKNIGKSGNKYSYIHIATHGFFEEGQKNKSFASTLDKRRGLDDPYLRAGLIFKNGGDIIRDNNLMNYNISEGILTAREVAQRDFSSTDIVVLSACETGLGDIESGEGVYGLQRAFLTAGVKIVIISLFKVDDTVTKLFMKKMSSKFIETKNSNVALKYAKKEVQKLYPEPIYWGSFIMAN